MDTVAVYQAAILAGGQYSTAAANLVERLHAAAVMWRPPPALTLLLVDDLDTCISRFECRLGTPVTPADRQLLATIAELYEHLAAMHPDRVRAISRAGRDAGDVLDEMQAHCLAVMKEATAS